MLSDRRQRVLAALIQEYVARAIPVGSRTLTERYQLGVSPATVRNELSILEEDGYITQPHTSAGRIPTDYGYRAFVDDMLQAEDPSEQQEDLRPAVEELRRSATELDSLIEQTSMALARLTDCLSIVLAPSVMNLNIKQLSLISITPHRAIIVVVTEEGQVLNRQMEFVEPVPSEALARVQGILNDAFAGKSLQDIQDGLGVGMVEAFRDPLVRVVLNEVVACLQESEMARTHRLGISALMMQPEFRQTQALVPIVQLLEDDAVLMELLDQSARGSSGELSVRIGRENASEELSGVSVVASRYGRGAGAGIVAVIGPTRMDYSRVIRAVRIASATLEEE